MLITEELRYKTTDIASKLELTALMNREEENTLKIKNLSEQLKSRSTEDEYIMKIANNKAESKVEKWQRHEFLQVLIPAISVIFVIVVAIIIWIKIEPLYGIISKLSPIDGINGTSSWSFFTWLISLFLGAVPNFLIIAPVKYLSSESRKKILIKKYSKESRKYLK